MSKSLMNIGWRATGDDDEPPPTREWLVPNGRGGYAAGPIGGGATRRYHGVLVASLPNPLGRTRVLNRLLEDLLLRDGRTMALGTAGKLDGAPTVDAVARLVEFRLDLGLPVWVFANGETRIEKRLVLPHGRNTVHVSYRLAGGEEGVQLRIRPALHFRPEGAPFSAGSALPYTLAWSSGKLDVNPPEPYPSLHLWLSAARSVFSIDPLTFEHVVYSVDEQRGESEARKLWSPGAFVADLEVGGEVTLVGSAEDWPIALAVGPAEIRSAERGRRERLLGAASGPESGEAWNQLVLAADAFTVLPGYRLHEVERARAAGARLATIIAGYYWFTDWGRDTMISLEGLCLHTGRHAEARDILQTFARYEKDGLIPNRFPAGSSEGLYNTADATLWFFHAIDRYVRVTGDRDFLNEVLPKLKDIINHHLAGTRYGIGVDSNDQLLRQGAPGVPLTWMDADYQGWVVTPRRGKAVEINALWYNALRLMERWTRESDGDGASGRYGELADRVRDSFNRRFWNEEGGYLFDVVDGETGDGDTSDESGDDASFRPNQIFAVSLPAPVLDRARWGMVVGAVRERLLTPFGLRSLDPADPHYHPSYHGARESRDSAYHQGTVWPWLVGPFIDAWLRVHPGDHATASGFLSGLIGHLGQEGTGSIAEVFDAEAPYTPRGCVAQAWSVAEVLRCWRLTHATAPLGGTPDGTAD